MQIAQQTPYAGAKILDFANFVYIDWKNIENFRKKYLHFLKEACNIMSR